MPEHEEEIVDDEMANLPDDDLLAFAAYEKRIRATTRDAGQFENGWHLERQYVTHLLAFVNVTNLNLDLDSNPPGDDGTFDRWFHEFTHVVDRIVLEVRLRHARSLKRDVVTAVYLSDDYRSEIHKLIGRIRKIVNQADLGDVKKDAIYDKIAKLQSEIDRSRTRFDAFLSRFLDLTNVVGEGAENLEPAVKLLGRLTEVIGRAKSAHDAGKLPSPEETRKLPRPESDQQPDSETDDLPF